MTNVMYGVLRYYRRVRCMYENPGFGSRLGVSPHTLSTNTAVYPETRLCLGSVQVSLEFLGVTSFELRTATEEKVMLLLQIIEPARFLGGKVRGLVGGAKPAGFRSSLCEDNYDRRMGKNVQYLHYQFTCRQPQEKHGALHTSLLPAPMTAVVSGNRGEASGVYHSAHPPPHATSCSVPCVR
ncbi:hypothetical protein OOU_Y34scaffold00590g92 [Pyricularia oryzae Y34]|uniref:Uncharacterized protein n=1 Tax=Pyricularia oryzae (strain Y34) TaxID=1143189 RepID=A0AA97PK29_PYRO3|nr:hypothetical protein OOU_Y34scaffold00590g92 [Pyricularia oryzae Y34]